MESMKRLSDYVYGRSLTVGDNKQLNEMIKDLVNIVESLEHFQPHVGLSVKKFFMDELYGLLRIKESRGC